jgi:formate dehydrogenase subunit gamma
MASSVHHGTSRDEVVVDRYNAPARANHWVTAISLILLALSGMSMFHPSLFFLTDLFGGGQWTRIIHPWIGVVLFFSFTGLFLRFWRANLWEHTDSVWLGSAGAVLTGHEERLPEIGRYNAGQKLVFWGMTLLIVVLFTSGITIWDRYFFAYSSIGTKRVAVVMHAAAAVCAILIWIVHVYAAIWVRGTVRAMTSGSVTGGWAWRHHRRWLREEVAKAKTE